MGQAHGEVALGGRAALHAHRVWNALEQGQGGELVTEDVLAVAEAFLNAHEHTAAGKIADSHTAAGELLYTSDFAQAKHLTTVRFH